MTAEEVLRKSEGVAAHDNQMNYTGQGNKENNKSFLSKKGTIVMFFITLIIGVLVLIVGFINLIPGAFISQIKNLMTENSLANTYSILSQLISFELKNGSVESGMIEKFEENGMKVGYLDGGQFIEVSATNTEKPDSMVSVNEDSGELTSSSVDLSILQDHGRPMVVKVDDRIITADEFPSVMMSDAKVMDIVNRSTYANTMLWFDESYETMLSRNGISRNVFKNNEDFSTVMNKVVGKGSSINVEGMNVSLIEQEGDEDNGEQQSIEVSLGGIFNSDSASNLTAGVAKTTKSSSSIQATVDAATTLTTSQIINGEQKAMQFAQGIVENFDKMIAGYGSDSQINESLNAMTTPAKSEVFDVDTYQMKESYGSMLEAPELYAALSGEKLNLEEIKNYSEENTTKAIKNMGYYDSSENGSFSNTLASVNGKGKGLIGRVISWLWNDEPDSDALSLVEPAVDQALVNNSFDDTQGILGGQRLMKGIMALSARNDRMSGATSGDREAVLAYRKQTNQVLALQAEIDRMNRSPFDITSKNTFLGSILYKFALSTIKSGTLLNKFSSLSRVVASSISSILPTTSADDGADDSYLSTFGEGCERFNSMYGAVSSPTCAQRVTFDTSEHYQISDKDSMFYQIASENIECDENNICQIKEGSDFEAFLVNYVNKLTPDGITDAGIVESLARDGEGTSFLSSLVGAVKSFFNLDEEDKMVASGAAYINSKNNPEWDPKYQYIQMYVAMVRIATSTDNQTAFSNIPFVGVNNPVLACLERINNSDIAATNE